MGTQPQVGGRGCHEIPGLIARMLRSMVCLSTLFGNLGPLYVSFGGQYQRVFGDKLSRGVFLDLVHKGFSGDAYGRSYQRMSKIASAVEAVMQCDTKLNKSSQSRGLQV